MIPEPDWSQVQDVFESALGLPPQQRDAWVREACRDRPALCREVLSLLQAEESSGSFLEAPFFDIRRDPDSDAATFPHCPRYRLVELLQRGGMGAVYRGLRADDEYRQEVCIKVLRRDLLAEEWVRRFRRERQILANLSHPNIARLLDGGTTLDGRPFLVMEYVQGLAIDRYCDVKRLGIQARTRLVAAVCRAVHAAHQSLIVHCDLKPSNILILDRGEPKLLDFGIAKLLDPDALGLTLAPTKTATAMTPEYASPEQVKRQPITTACDIYSLGVIAYELLAGAKPYRAGSRSGLEVAKAICEEEPIRPSSAVLQATRSRPGKSEPGAAADAGRAAFRSSQARRARQLKGDLDTIVLKALHKDPQRRFASALEMAEDLERHLAGKPVSARPDRHAYRLGLFVRRHKIGSAGAAALAILLVAFAVTFFVQHQRVLKEKRRAEETARFLVELFSIPDPDRSLGENVTAREVMDRGAAEIDLRLNGEPDLRADLKETIGKVYLRLGLYKEADSLIRESLELRRRIYGGGGPEIVPNLILLGLLEMHVGHWKEGEDWYRQAAGILRQEGRDESLEMAQALHGMAVAARSQGDYDQAESLHLQSISLSERLPGQARSQFATSLRSLGVLMRIQGKLDEAEALSQRSLDIFRSLYGDRHPEVAGMLNNLALIDVDRREYARAEERFRQALSIQRQIYQADHPSQANVQDNLASLLYDLGRYQESEALSREALEIRRSAYPERHPKIAQSLNLLGLSLREQDKLEEAEEPLRQALQQWTQLYGEKNPKAVAGMINVADLLYSRKDYPEAGALYERALDALKAAGDGPSPTLGLVLNRLGRLRKAQGDYSAAQQRYQEAIALLRRQHGNQHPEVATAVHNLAALLQGRGEAAKAEPLYREALSIFQAAYGEDHPHTALVEKNLAAALIETGRFPEAEALSQHAVQVFAKKLSKEHSWFLAAQSILGRSLLAQGKHSEAEHVLIEVYEKSSQLYGPDSPKTASATEQLARLYESWGKPSKASNYRHKASNKHSSSKGAN